MNKAIKSLVLVLGISAFFVNSNIKSVDCLQNISERAKTLAIIPSAWLRQIVKNYPREMAIVGGVQVIIISAWLIHKIQACQHLKARKRSAFQWSLDSKISVYEAIYAAAIGKDRNLKPFDEIVTALAKIKDFKSLKDSLDLSVFDDLQKELTELSFSSERKAELLNEFTTLKGKVNLLLSKLNAINEDDLQKALAAKRRDMQIEETKKLIEQNRNSLKQVEQDFSKKVVMDLNFYLKDSQFNYDDFPLLNALQFLGGDRNYRSTLRINLEDIKAIANQLADQQTSLKAERYLQQLQKCIQLIRSSNEYKKERELQEIIKLRDCIASQKKTSNITQVNVLSVPKKENYSVFVHEKICKDNHVGSKPKNTEKMVNKSQNPDQKKSENKDDKKQEQSVNKEHKIQEYQEDAQFDWTLAACQGVHLPGSTYIPGRE
ncbi:TPA: hypothetical protein DEO28_00190 [Candidatus Dependentiae bacterium]|nr:MAG: hypothetical protein UR14_C0001G0104 [candidate division TM6 bacterium GW2011_GWE2_31_21]KKP54016.1 MAG: hypothetical protein UR43_C0001G0034 [candidate division TM6 bacterium GW2011_GWF2_33_332]HBS48403.1 hypothetical protein [Candidatus Dependentiae bacterium]HBZ72923.1 hypothetical protein [Candidatus Dependentiae bacterium]